MRTVVAGGLILALMSTLAMAEPLGVKIAYLGRAEKKATISLVDFPPDDDSVAGVRLALEDNNTTGKFLNQHFSLEQVRPASATLSSETMATGSSPSLTRNSPIAASRFSSSIFPPMRMTALDGQAWTAARMEEEPT